MTSNRWEHPAIAPVRPVETLSLPEVAGSHPPMSSPEERDNSSWKPTKVAGNHFQCDTVIVNEMGLHARPATLFVNLANLYQCDVKIHKGSKQVDGKSILQLLTLSAEAGAHLTLETRGADAEDAIVALANLIASGFNEIGPANGSGH